MRVWSLPGAWSYLAMGNHGITLSRTDSQNKDNKWLAQFFSTKLERPWRAYCLLSGYRIYNKGEEIELMA